tara:strand:+ start:6872 stop:7000 length:129 start_codon:yes stop_codon:yes gene_type:complete
VFGANYPASFLAQPGGGGQGGGGRNSTSALQIRWVFWVGLVG